jgi:hypothetical protein
MVDGVAHDVEKGSAVFIPGDAEHGVRNEGAEELKWLYVCFPWEILGRLCIGLKGRAGGRLYLQNYEWACRASRCAKMKGHNDWPSAGQFEAINGTSGFGHPQMQIARCRVQLKTRLFGVCA